MKCSHMLVDASSANMNYCRLCQSIGDNRYVDKDTCNSDNCDFFEGYEEEEGCEDGEADEGND